MKTLVLALLVIWAIWALHRRRRLRETLYRQHLEEEVRDRTRELAQRNSQLEQSYAQLEEVNSRLEEVSQTDALTGLGNRRSLNESIPRLVASIDAANRYAPRSPERLALLVIDVDNLKPINDRYGHEAGDQLLSQLSSVLADSALDSDEVARWGGDEFVIVRSGCSLNDAAVLAERIRSNIARRRFRVAGRRIARASVSIGFSFYPFVAAAPHLVPWEEVLNLADVALYRAKRMRNSWMGWLGTGSAASLTDVRALLENDPERAEREGYVESRSSVRDVNEIVEILVRDRLATGQ